MRILTYVFIGLTVGGVSGALGVCGRALPVPLLIRLRGLAPRKAAAPSLAIPAPPIGLPAALLAYREERVDLEAALWIAGAFMLGAYGSQYLVHHLPEERLRIRFGLLMFYVGTRFLLYTDSDADNEAAGLIAACYASSVFPFVMSM